jgi:hypothetical protein
MYVSMERNAWVPRAQDYPRASALIGAGQKERDGTIAVVPAKTGTQRAGTLAVVPAKAGTQWRSFKRHRIPAFAGMTISKHFAQFVTLDARQSMRRQLKAQVT